MNNDLQNVATGTLELVRGDYEGLELRFTDETNGNSPIDISNYVLYLTLKQDRKDDDEDALLQVIITEHQHGLEGIGVIEVTEEQWDTGFKGQPVPSGQCQFDIQVQDEVGGEPKTIIIGDCIVVQDVTHGVSN